MKNRIQIFIVTLFTFSLTVMVGQMKAQTVSDNTIQEVQVNKNDAFKEIRNLLINNFDFTNQDYKQGIVNSEVKFDIAKNGKIVNVHSEGDCKNVSKEIENVLSHLQYKITSDKLNDNMLASTYVMPVILDVRND